MNPLKSDDEFEKEMGNQKPNSLHRPPPNSASAFIKSIQLQKRRNKKSTLPVQNYKKILTMTSISGVNEIDAKHSTTTKTESKCLCYVIMRLKMYTQYI